MKAQVVTHLTSEPFELLHGPPSIALNYVGTLKRNIFIKPLDKSYITVPKVMSIRVALIGAIIGDYFFIHGGISNASNKSQLCRNSLYKIQISPLIGQWTEATTADSPFLSQHQCVPHHPSGCLCFVGGWNGKARSAGVHVFDTNSGRWLPSAVSEPLLQGFPKGAGLSGHSLVPLVTRKDQIAALVIGREGSLRTQRKYCSSYILRGHIDISDQNSNIPLGNRQSPFVYSELPSTTASRSHHTISPITAHTAVIVGGRATGFAETFTAPFDIVFDCQTDCCEAVTRFLKCFSRMGCSPIAESRLYQIGIRGHYAISGGEGVLIGGGESFNALQKDPNGEAFVCFSSTKIFSLGEMEDRRCYAVCAVSPVDGTAWLQGGLGSGQRPIRTLSRLICTD